MLPITARLASPLVCPAGAHIELRPHPGVNEIGQSVTTNEPFCVNGAAAQGPMTGQVMLALGGIYFVVALLPLMAWGLTWNAAPPVRRARQPLGWENERIVRAHLSAGRKIEAIKLVRQQTGMGLREAKTYVEVMAGDATLPPND
jgi:hypothetical protein